MNNLKIKWVLLAVALVGAIAIGPAQKAEAFDFGDLIDWMDECNLGKLLDPFGLSSLIDGKLPDGRDYIGNVVTFGECQADVAELWDEWFPEDPASLVWVPASDNLPGHFTSGKLVIKERRKYVFKVGDSFFETGAGKIFRHKKVNKAEYVKAYYSTIATIYSSGKLKLEVHGNALPNTSSQTPLSLAGVAPVTPGVDLVDVKFSVNGWDRWVDYGVWYVRKYGHAKAKVRTAAGAETWVDIDLGKMVSRSVPESVRRHQHVVYRNL